MQEHTQVLPLILGLSKPCRDSLHYLLECWITNLKQNHNGKLVKLEIEYFAACGIKRL